MVVTKLDLLARSLPDARAIADELTAGPGPSQPRRVGVRPPIRSAGCCSMGSQWLLSSDLIRLRTKEVPGFCSPGTYRVQWLPEVIEGQLRFDDATNHNTCLEQRLDTDGVQTGIVQDGVDPKVGLQRFCRVHHLG